jgi:hypothetical protein
MQWCIKEHGRVNEEARAEQRFSPEFRSQGNMDIIVLDWSSLDRRCPRTLLVWLAMLE